MATLLPLHPIDVATHLSEVRGLQNQAKAYSKMGAPSVPGVPDIKETLKVMVEAEAKKLLDDVRLELIAILIPIMGAGLAKLAELIPAINKVIEVLNKIIDTIGTVIKALLAIAFVTFILIITLTVLFVVTAIITMIPSTAVAMGVGVSFDMVKSIAQKIMNACDSWLEILWPIAFKVVAVVMTLLKMYGFLTMMMGIVKMFTKQQTNSTSTASNAFNKSADDWANATSTIGGDKSAGGSGSGVSGKDKDLHLVECTLPNGEVRMMTADDCLAAGGAFDGMDLLSKLNDLDRNIMSLGNFPPVDPNLCWEQCEHGLDLDGTKKITCQLPDGSSRDMTLQECNEESGIDKSMANILNNLARLKSERDGICVELGPLCDYKLDDNIITSLKNINEDATIGKSTKNTGKRKGFYSEDI